MYSSPYEQLYYNAEIVGWSPSFNNDEFMSVINDRGVIMIATKLEIQGRIQRRVYLRFRRNH